MALLSRRRHALRQSNGVSIMDERAEGIGGGIGLFLSLFLCIFVFQIADAWMITVISVTVAFLFALLFHRIGKRLGKPTEADENGDTVQDGWTCKACGSTNPQGAMSCRDCGRYK